MAGFMSQYLVPIAIGAVADRAGARSRQHDARRLAQHLAALMRLRVLLQFVAIIVIMATVWLMGG